MITITITTINNNKDTKMTTKLIVQVELVMLKGGKDRGLESYGRIRMNKDEVRGNNNVTQRTTTPPPVVDGFF